MKDLKHLYELENLLQDADNELVRKARDNGGLALGYTCYHIPEVLLNLDSCFSVRLRAPRTGSLDISTYYLSNFLCEYCKALLERGLEGGFNFLSAIISSETCSEMNRSMEHFQLLGVVPNEKFFVSFLDFPFKDTEHAIAHYVQQLRIKLLQPLQEVYGVDVSEASIRKAVAEHNRICRAIHEIGELRKLDNPPITGYEFHILCLASYCCPKAYIAEILEETLAELKTRKPDEKSACRARVVVVGSEVDDPSFTKLMEDSGLYIAADRFCFGSIPGREEIELPDGMDVLEAVARHYIRTSQCPRFMTRNKVDGRHELVRQLCQDYHADGVVYEQLKFCEFWGYERALGSYVVTNDFDIPSIMIDRQYVSGVSGQLRTRMQAFAESLEIKRIAKNREAQNG